MNKKRKVTAGWSARFSAPLLAEVARFNASISFDQRLAKFDLLASIAHVNMLGKQKIIAQADAKRIIVGLQKLSKECDQGVFSQRLAEGDEDIHFAIERILIGMIGEVGKKMHTARSRNDQVATDMRLYLMHVIDAQSEGLRALIDSCARLALAHHAMVMPGMTHLQFAQPVTVGHHLLAYAQMFKRDFQRFAYAHKSASVMPLGSGALAGVGYNIDRQAVAKQLGFVQISTNSIDAVSDRDFIADYLYAATMFSMHVSRLCEELILWNNQLFAWVKLPDQYCTGSSIMPQKKNPDVPELARGKCARVYAALHSILVLLKSQPLAYNKDNQEDKQMLFDAVDTLDELLPILTAMVGDLSFDADALEKAIGLGHLCATEMADELVRQQVSFRDAHTLVSALVADAEASKQSLTQYDSARLEELFKPYLVKFKFKAKLDFVELRASLDPKRALAVRKHVGGTAPTQVKAQAKALIEECKRKRFN